MKNENTISRFSYTDDIEILGFGRTVEDWVDAARRKIHSLTTWVDKNVVLFDAKKTEGYSKLWEESLKEELKALKDTNTYQLFEKKKRK